MRRVFVAVISLHFSVVAAMSAQTGSIAPTAAPSKTSPTTAAAPAANPQSAKTEKTGAGSKSVKAESVTINMPEGMTHDQADAILNELKAIHQLLQAQPNNRAAAPRSEEHTSELQSLRH